MKEKFFMKNIKAAIFTFVLSAAAFHVQALNISGVVKNEKGNGIGGALVRLGKNNLATKTDPDGSFLITENISKIKQATRHSASGNHHPFTFKNNTIFFNSSPNTDVMVSIFNLNGKRLFFRKKFISAKDRSIALNHHTGGIYINSVSINNIEYTFKYIKGTDTNARPVSKWKNIKTKQAQTNKPLDDALLFTKEGYQLHRLAISTPDTSGISVILNPLVTGTVTDADGNIYQTVQYGKQEWTIENLMTTRFNDGSSIPLVIDSTLWPTLVTPACCFYGNTTDIIEQKKWGALYNWHAANSNKLAPEGWHIPTNADWDTLQAFLVAGGYNFDGTTSENNLAKSMAATTDWLSNSDTGSAGFDTSNNNISSFNGIPNGYRDYDGWYTYRNWYAFWWTSTETDSLNAVIRGLSYAGQDLKRNSFNKMYGISVRLVRYKKT